MVTRSPHVAVLRAAWMPAACALLACLPGIQADAEPTLLEQISAGTENRHLGCWDPGHLLAVRQDFRLACASPGSISALGWEEAGFTGTNDLVVNSTLHIEDGGYAYEIGYVITNGLVGRAERDESDSVLILEIDSAGRGGIILEIPRAFYSWVGPDARASIVAVIQVMDKERAVEHHQALERGIHRVWFEFLDEDPEFKIINFVAIADAPPRRPPG